jgi:DNA-binding transcriptional ArsR family regulator
MYDRYHREYDRTRDGIIQWVLALNRVTDHFPATEPLRPRMREGALHLVASVEGFLVFPSAEARDNVMRAANTLLSFCSIADTQRWVHADNFSFLARELHRWLGALPEPQPTLFTPSKTPAPRVRKQPQRREAPSRDGALSRRQQQILSHLAANPSVHVGDLARVFPTISKRTIRRDLETLLRRRLVERQGKTNGTVYSLIRTA